MLLCVLLLLPSLASCGVPEAIGKLFDRDEPAAREVRVSVMLALGEGVTVVGDNPVRVAPGEDAVFEVRVEDGLRLEEFEDEDIEYQNGLLTVPAVRMPRTVAVRSRPAVSYPFSLTEGVSASVKSGEYAEGTKIRLFADGNNGKNIFIGFSNGAMLRDGGELLSNDANCEITLSKETKVYANYAAEGAMLLIYHTNGGRTSGGSNVMSVEINNSVYICPNTLPDNGTFLRDGYILGGYNTEPDGSGRYYGCGWNVVLPENKVADLYAVWVPETPASDFTYTKSSKDVTITRYNGKDETVVIPKKIEGLPVTTIGAQSFLGSTFKTIYISSSVKSVKDNAFVKCGNFTTLYLYDSVNIIKDAAFSGCSNFSTIYLQAVIAPRYINGRNGTYQVKYERLMTAPSPKLVLHAGSNVAYGVDSALLEQEIGNRYNVVNYGCNQSTPACFYIEVIAYWANPGDILIHAPEGFSRYQFGYNEMNTTTWQIFEGAFDAFSCVDLRHLVKFFDSFTEFQSARSGKAAVTYEHYTSETVNQYGDYIKQKTGTKYSPSVNSRSYDPAVYQKDYARINLAYDLCRAKGMEVWHSFGVVNIVSLKAASKTAEVQKTYIDGLKELLKIDAFISDLSNYIMDSKYFFNSDFHLNTAGSQIRTKNLAKDILAQLEREGKK